MDPDPLFWPAPGTDPDQIERTPLEDRGLPDSTYAVLRRAATLWPDRPAVTFLPDAERWQQPWSTTFADLADAVTRTANLLRALGADTTAPVALLSLNCPDLVVALLAAQAVSVAQPVNPALSARDAAELLRRSGAKVVVAAGPELDPAGWASARTVAETVGASALLALRPLGTAARAPALAPLAGCRVSYLTEAAADGPANLLVGAPGPEDPAAYFHTGGTTGSPKLAGHTHANEVANAWMVAATSSLGQDAVVFAALPLFHVNALVVTLLAPLLRGQHVVWAGPAGYRDTALYGIFWRLVERHRISAMSGVPTVYAALAQVPVDADIGSLQVAAVGAAPLPPSVRAAWRQRTGIELLEGYGLTEATCASARGVPGAPAVGCVGRRLPYQQVKTVLADPDTGVRTDLPVGTTGRLCVKGPNVFRGYLVGTDGGRPVLDDRGTVVDGWLDTGDIGFVDDAGGIWLTGRTKDLIIRGGHNIDPRTIEDALLLHPDVTAAGAVGRPDGHAGEVPVAFVTLKSGSRATPERLRRWAAEHVPERASAPAHIHVLETLPVTDVGKPYKLALRLLATRQEVADRLDVPLEEVTASIVSGRTEVVVPRADPVLDGYGFEWRER